MPASGVPRKAKCSYCPLRPVLEPAQSPLKEPQFLSGFVSDFIVLHFCSASQSHRTWLVKNVNQIGESQQSSSPPLFGSPPLPPGQGNHQSRGATTKLFPEPISCWTVCYTLSNIPKIILTSKPALIWTPSLSSPPAFAGKHISRSRGSPWKVETPVCRARLFLRGREVPEQKGKKKRKEKKKIHGRPHLFSVVHCPWLGSSVPSRGERTASLAFSRPQTSNGSGYDFSTAGLAGVVTPRRSWAGFSLRAQEHRCVGKGWGGKSFSRRGNTAPVPSKLRRARLWCHQASEALDKSSLNGRNSQRSFVFLFPPFPHS